MSSIVIKIDSFSYQITNNIDFTGPVEYKSPFLHPVNPPLLPPVIAESKKQMESDLKRINFLIAKDISEKDVLNARFHEAILQPEFVKKNREKMG